MHGVDADAMVAVAVVDLRRGVEADVELYPAGVGGEVAIDAP
jgi:hypothetical protein